MGSKIDNISIAQLTLNTVKKGEYNLGAEIIKLPKLQKGLFYNPKNEVAINNTFKTCNISVVNERTVDTIFKLKDVDNVGVLNFASAYNPGGGFLRSGSQAQEESLAYCSDLYNTQLGNEYYVRNKAVRTKMYTDNMIIGDVVFFKDADFNFAPKPKVVKVITSAAVNMKQVIIKGEDSAIAKKVMKDRMRRILFAFIDNKCETIVLGAYGCGVFGNDGLEIANNWLDLLEKENLKNCFKEVIFTVYDSKNTKFSNYNIFKRAFNVK